MSPNHMFRVASKAKIGVVLVQTHSGGGLIARLRMDYPKVPYQLKINSKTDLIKPLKLTLSQ
jgi:DhnA family fructose-bisphosphate aldolase class Ia